MSFGQSVSICLKKYVDFNGRAMRSEYWWFFLFCTLLSVLAEVIEFAIYGADNSGYMGTIVSLALFLPNLSVGARRLHDIGRSGWWQLLHLVLIIGSVILIFFFIKKGEEQENAYGAPPQAGAEPASS